MYLSLALSTAYVQSTYVHMHSSIQDHCFKCMHIRILSLSLHDGKKIEIDYYGIMGGKICMHSTYAYAHTSVATRSNMHSMHIPNMLLKTSIVLTRLHTVHSNTSILHNLKPHIQHTYACIFEHVAINKRQFRLWCMHST